MHQLVYPFNKKWLSTHDVQGSMLESPLNNGPFLSKQCECVYCVHGYLSQSSVNMSIVYTVISPTVWMCPLYTWLSLPQQCECVHCTHIHFSIAVWMSAVYVAVSSTIVWMCPVHTWLSFPPQYGPVKVYMSVSLIAMWTGHCPSGHLFSMALWMCPLHTWPFFPPTRFPKERPNLLPPGFFHGTFEWLLN